MSVELFTALRTFVNGLGPILGGSLTQLNTMSLTTYSD